MEEILAGVNESGENVLFCEYDDRTVTKTMQNNGWIRVTTRWDDGTVEETFEH